MSWTPRSAMVRAANASAVVPISSTMITSGVWFSTEGVHAWVAKLSAVLPLTHVIDACRAIMIDGAGLLQVFPQVAVLLGTSLAFLAIGAFMFRWE